MFVPKFFLSFTKLAQKDIDDILAYTFEVWGEKKLAVYKSDLDDVVAKIVENPKQRRERNHGLRVYPVAKHRVFYRMDEDIVTIIRVLHERMDEGAHVGM